MEEAVSAAERLVLALDRLKCASLIDGFGGGSQDASATGDCTPRATSSKHSAVTSQVHGTPFYRPYHSFADIATAVDTGFAPGPHNDVAVAITIPSYARPTAKAASSERDSRSRAVHQRLQKSAEQHAWVSAEWPAGRTPPSAITSPRGPEYVSRIPMPHPRLRRAACNGTYAAVAITTRALNQREPALSVPLQRCSLHASVRAEGKGAVLGDAAADLPAA